MRTYKNANGEYYYSAWTSTRVIKTKRKEIKLNKKYTHRYYSDYYTNGYVYSVIKFKSGKKIEFNMISGMEGFTYKGTYKQKGDTITAKLEFFDEFLGYDKINITITIIDSKNISIYYNDWGGTESYMIM